MNLPVVILKYGSSVLAGHDSLPDIVHDVYRYYRRGQRVLVVVSARDGETERLLSEASAVSDSPAPGPLAELLATGEQQSAALLAIALERAGVGTAVLTPAAIGLRVRGPRLDAVPVSVDAAPVRTAFEDSAVVVVPGFAGIHDSGGTALLGRGGSDLTAVFLARQLGASDCRLLKDVDGIYRRDPATATDGDERPGRFGAVTWDDALRVSGGLVQPKAIEYLRDHRAVASLGALFAQEHTQIGAAETRVRDLPPIAPQRVVLFGLGTVGQGVYRHLQRLAGHFEIAGILVRNPGKVRAFEAPAALLDTDLDRLLSRPHDVVVDACGDPAVVQQAIERSLAGGRSVVTASKQIVAASGPRLEHLAVQHGASFRYSAAVGGGVPMIEALDEALRDGTVTELRGVLNGTCNFVLDQLARGVPFHTAVSEARRLGFAEANASRDLHGDDAADKLRILARRAFGDEAGVQTIHCEKLSPAEPWHFAAAGSAGRVVRQVARFVPGRGGSVRLEGLPADDYLAGAAGEENRLVISLADGRALRVSGKGAGRWPTAEAVIADLLDVRAELRGEAERSSGEVDSTTSCAMIA